jgi:hypothetical protein
VMAARLSTAVLAKPAAKSPPAKSPADKGTEPEHHRREHEQCREREAPEVAAPAAQGPREGAQMRARGGAERCCAHPEQARVPGRPSHVRLRSTSSMAQTHCAAQASACGVELNHTRNESRARARACPHAPKPPLVTVGPCTGPRMHAPLHTSDSSIDVISVTLPQLTGGCTACHPLT